MGCGGAHHPRPAALRLERADLVLLAHTLQRLEAPTGGEAAAARAVWPALAHGLPRSLSPAQRLALATAGRRAAALALPWYVTTEAGGLTGPATTVGELLKSYAGLTPRGWRFIAAALAAESRGPALPASRFLRANAGLYIYCVYDGHYDLSLVGKALRSAYRKLGGAPAFGRSLTQSQVEALARAYSIPAGRLTPHPPVGLAV
jgi:hypothetical protein